MCVCSVWTSHSQVWFSTSSHPLVEQHTNIKLYGPQNSKKRTCKHVTAVDNANDSELTEVHVQYIPVLSQSDNDRDKGNDKDSENGGDNSSDRLQRQQWLQWVNIILKGLSMRIFKVINPSTNQWINDNSTYKLVIKLLYIWLNILVLCLYSVLQ